MMKEMEEIKGKKELKAEIKEPFVKVHTYLKLSSIQRLLAFFSPSFNRRQCAIMSSGMQ